MKLSNPHDNLIHINLQLQSTPPLTTQTHTKTQFIYNGRRGGGGGEDDVMAFHKGSVVDDNIWNKQSRVWCGMLVLMHMCNMLGWNNFILEIGDMATFQVNF